MHHPTKSPEVEPETSPGRHGHHGLPGLPAPAAYAVCVEGSGRIRGYVHGSSLLLRLLRIDGTGARTRPLLELSRLAVGSRHSPAGFAEAAGRGSRRVRGSGRQRVDGLERTSFAGCQVPEWDTRTR